MIVPSPDTEEALSRRRHFGAFYGETEPPPGFGLVVGNCQAESIRIVIESTHIPTIRVPPVHELTAADADLLHGLLPRASFLVAQPVRDGYHGLQLGTRQLRSAMSAAARVVTITPIRFAGLYPFQVAIRVPGVDEVPPLVAYHDVRTLAAAAGLPMAPDLEPAVVRHIGGDSLRELRRREARTDVRVADLFASPAFDQMRTVNHPGNAVFLSVGERIIRELAVDAETSDPGRPLLSSVEAPREDWVLRAWGSADEPRDYWMVGAVQVSREAVRDAHAEWYARHPRFVVGAVERLKPLLARWGVV